VLDNCQKRPTYFEVGKATRTRRNFFNSE